MRPDVRVGRDVSCGSIEDVWVMPDRSSDPPEDQGGTPVPRSSATLPARRFCAFDGHSSSSLPVHHSSVPIGFSHLFRAAKDRAFYPCSVAAAGSFRQATPATCQPVDTDESPHSVKLHASHFLSLGLARQLQRRRAVWWQASAPACASNETPDCSRCLRRKCWADEATPPLIESALHLCCRSAGVADRWKRTSLSSARDQPVWPRPRNLHGWGLPPR